MAVTFAPAASPFVKARARKPDDGRCLKSPIMLDSGLLRVTNLKVYCGFVSVRSLYEAFCDPSAMDGMVMDGADTARMSDVETSDRAAMHQHPPQAFNKACRLAEGHSEQHFHGQASPDRGAAERSRSAPLAGRCGPPPVHLRIEPNRQ